MATLDRLTKCKSLATVKCKAHDWEHKEVQGYIFYTHKETKCTLVHNEGDVLRDITEDAEPNEILEYHLQKRARAFATIIGKYDDIMGMEGTEDVDDGTKAFVDEYAEALKYFFTFHHTVVFFSKGEHPYIIPKLQDKSGNELKLQVPALSKYADEFNRVFPQRALSPQDALRAGCKYKDDSFIDSHMYRDFKNDPQNNDPYKYVPESIMKLFRNKKLRKSELRCDF